MRYTSALAVLVLGCVASCSGDMPSAPSALQPETKFQVNVAVLDRDGDPVSPARLFFRLEGVTSPPPSGSYEFVETDENGAFSVELLKGRYQVQIGPPYDQGLPAVDTTFVVGAGLNRLEYRYSGVLVTGTATGPGDGAMRNFYVVASGIDVPYYISTSGEDGTYRLLLKPGRYAFRAYPGGPEGMAHFEFVAAISTQDTVIDLDFSGHEISVRVS